MKKGVHKKLTKATKPITNEDVLQAIVHLTDNAATKEDIAYLKSVMATRKHIEAVKEDIDILGEEIDTIQGEMRYMRGEMARLPTKDDLQAAKEEVIIHFEPLERAFDNDAEILVKYGARLERIEKILALQ